MLLLFEKDEDAFDQVVVDAVLGWKLICGLSGTGCLCLCPDQLDLFNSLVFCDFFFTCTSEILRLDKAGWEWLADVKAWSS
jgi:hypothetical protein